MAASRGRNAAATASPLRSARPATQVEAGTSGSQTVKHRFQQDGVTVGDMSFASTRR